jgi:predicted dehydrogenase
MVKIGIIGVGRLGSQHVEQLLESPLFEVIGCYDNNPGQLQKIREDYDVATFDQVEDLIDRCDALDIVTPATTHYFYSEKAIRKGKHVFVEKPISDDPEEAEQMVKLANEAGIKMQIGHIERFNPAYLALSGTTLHPMFIESHRMAHFDPRGTDVSVVLDLMIHDIDIILHLVKANIRSISASGVPVVTEHPDIANARIEFDNGCVANLTASRVSMNKVRKMRFFQKDHSICIDFLHRETDILHVSEHSGHNSIPIRTAETVRYLNSQNVPAQEYDALKEELESFAHCITDNTEPRVSGQDGFRSLEVAHEILKKINRANGNGYHNGNAA